MLDLPRAQERKPHACGASIPFLLPPSPQKKPRPLHGIGSFSCQDLLSRPLVSYLPSWAEATKRSLTRTRSQERSLLGVLMLNHPTPRQQKCLENRIPVAVSYVRCITLEQGSPNPTQLVYTLAHACKHDTHTHMHAELQQCPRDSSLARVPGSTHCVTLDQVTCSTCSRNLKHIAFAQD